jgi:hypothetical protein
MVMNSFTPSLSGPGSKTVGWRRRKREEGHDNEGGG